MAALEESGQSLDNYFPRFTAVHGGPLRAGEVVLMIREAVSGFSDKDVHYLLVGEGLAIWRPCQRLP